MPGPSAGLVDRDRLLAMGMASALVQALEQQACGAGKSGPLGTGAFFGTQGNVFVYAPAAAGGNGADTTEDTITSFALPANAFDLAARGMWIYAFGTYANNTDTKAARCRFGASINIAAATGQNVGWATELLVFKNGASSQIANGQTISGTTHGGTTLPLAGTETDTAPITIKVTGQDSSTATASSVTCSGCMMTFMN